MQKLSLEMRLLAPLFGLLLIACSGTAGTDLGSDGLVSLPEPKDAGALSEASTPPPSDGGTTPPAEAGVGELGTVSLTIAKEARPITLTDPNFVPNAKLSADGLSLEISAWVTPPNTHDGGYSVEESVHLTVPIKVGTANCAKGGVAYQHSRLYDLSPPGAPVYNPFESFETKDSGGACSLVTKSVTDTWVEGSASGTLTRIKNVNGTSAATLAFTISYRVPRR